MIHLGSLGLSRNGFWGKSMAEKFDWKKIIKGTGKENRTGDVIYLPPNNEVRLPMASEPVATNQAGGTLVAPPIVLAPHAPAVPVHPGYVKPDLIIPPATPQADQPADLPWWAKGDGAPVVNQFSTPVAPVVPSAPVVQAPISPVAPAMDIPPMPTPGRVTAAPAQEYISLAPPAASLPTFEMPAVEPVQSPVEKPVTPVFQVSDFPAPHIEAPLISAPTVREPEVTAPAEFFGAPLSVNEPESVVPPISTQFVAPIAPDFTEPLVPTFADLSAPIAFETISLAPIEPVVHAPAPVEFKLEEPKPVELAPPVPSVEAPVEMVTPIHVEPKPAEPIELAPRVPTMDAPVEMVKPIHFEAPQGFEPIVLAPLEPVEAPVTKAPMLFQPVLEDVVPPAIPVDQKSVMPPAPLGPVSFAPMKPVQPVVPQEPVQVELSDPKVENIEPISLAKIHVELPTAAVEPTVLAHEETAPVESLTPVEPEPPTLLREFAPTPKVLEPISLAPIQVEPVAVEPSSVESLPLEPVALDAEMPEPEGPALTTAFPPGLLQAIPSPGLDQVPTREPAAFKPIPRPLFTQEAASLEGLPPADPTKLGLLLLDHKLISRPQLERALQQQVETRQSLGSILVGMKAITEKRLVQVVAAQSGVTAWHLETDPPTPEALTLLPGEVCKELQVLPVAVRGDLLLLAMRDTSDTAAMEAVRELTHMRLEPVLAEEQRLAHTIDSAYAIRDSRAMANVDDLVDQALRDYGSSRSKSSDRSQLTEEDTRPVVGLVNQIIQDAIRMRASDIHIEPREDKADIRYRLDGELLKVQSIPEALIPMLTTRIKIMAEMDIVEYRTPQDGRISAQVGTSRVDIRVSSLPNHYGQRMVLRILDKAVGLRRLEKLGFDEENLSMFRTLIAKPYGLLLVTGPTGSGKTTTLYAALNEIKRDGSNIMTCEDPIEYDLEGINQSQVNEKVGLTFAEQLRATLRQDPDVILVGEIRDQETAQTAIRAALTGHLVLSTLHSNDAPSAIPRLLDMDIDPYLLSTALIGTISQRLLRVICPYCRQPHSATQEEGELLHKYFGVNERPELFEGMGCEKCFNTGYKGRMAVHEIMPVVDEVAKLIAARAPVEAVRASASNYGYLSMQDDALSRVLRGQTSLAEVRRLLFFDSFERREAPRARPV